MDQYLPERRPARGWSGHRSAPSSTIPRCRSSSAHRAARTITDVCGPRLPRTLEHGSGGGRGGRPPTGGGTRASHRGASSCPGSPERCERKRAMVPIPWQSVLTLILGSGNGARENSRDSLSLLRVFSGGRGGRPPTGGGTRASHRGASSCPGSPERCERKRAMVPIPWQSVLTLILGSGNGARENSRDSLSLLRVFSVCFFF
jgi:hypothetical protein